VKILIAEDGKVIRKENERALTKAGYEVLGAEDGEAALRIAQEQMPDLILLDLLLPKITGTEVLQRLRANARTAGIPVVILSALSDKNRDKLIAAGADDYLEKNTLMPTRGENLLPQKLEDVICRINRRRGISFSAVPIKR
jgi:DNA-binding response OmpR family regulator